jgi:P4 family phage/plasmid primase-like protien
MKLQLSINRKIINKGPADTYGWQNSEMTVEEFIKFVTVTGGAYSGGVLKEGKSNKKPAASDIERAQILSLDFDNCVKVYNKQTRTYDEHKKSLAEGYTSFDTVVGDPWINDNALFAYSTPTSTPDHNRFRVVFILPEPVTDPLEYAKIADAFIRKFDSDTSCKNIDRFFYGNEKAEVKIFNSFLSKKTLKEIVKAEESERKEYRTYNSIRNGDLTEGDVAEMLSYIPRRMGYDEWGKIVSAVGNYFENSPETAFRLIENWSPDDKVGTRYRIEHRSLKPGIASVVWYAKKFGYNTKKIYKDYSNTIVTPDGEMVQKSEGLKIYPLTELGNSERFVDMWRDQVLYNHTNGKWHIWNGKYWEADNKNAIIGLAKITVRSIYNEVHEAQTEEKKSQISKHAIRSESKAQIESMIRLAAAHPEIAIEHSEMDADLFLINLQNGVYNLKTNEFLEHDPKYKLTKIAGVNFDPNANCYLWEDVMLTVFDSKEDMINFVQKACGLTFCGAHIEEVLFFCFGTGKNGKTIFFKVMEMIFGDYYQRAPTEMLLNRQSENIPNDIARLPGARLVVTAELPENRSFNENKIKDLTGGDSITARFLHKEFFDFNPTHTLWMYGNHKPNIKGNDEGIWRRICLIPFTVTIPEAERRPQYELMNDLDLEKSGILNWIIQGWQKYQKEGLNPPEDVKEATKEYRSENDKIADFVQECCELGENKKVTSSDLLHFYYSWCDKYRERPLTKNKFYKRISERDEVTPSNGNRNVKIFIGIGLNENIEFPEIHKNNQKSFNQQQEDMPF